MAFSWIHNAIEYDYKFYDREKSLVAKWLEQTSYGCEIYCHDLEVVSSNPIRIELGMHSTSVLSRT